jgi:hypothetical protein
MAAEDELHAQEQAEHARAQEWLKEQQASFREERKRRHAELAEGLEQARKTAREAAERSAAETVRQAELRARRLAGLDDGVLGRIVGRHLAAIITGRIP